MIQVVNQRPGGLGYIHPRSRTMICPGARERVRTLQGDADKTRLSLAARFDGLGDNGMGFFSTVPTWAWALGGGLVAGLVVGAVIYKKKG